MGIRSVLIADGNDNFIKDSVEFLNKHFAVPVIGISFNGEDAVDKVIKLSPEILIIDITAEKLNGLEAARSLKKLIDPPKVIISSDFDNSDYRKLARQYGADAFVCKKKFDTQLPHILKIINSNIEGLYDKLQLAKN